MRCLRGFAVAPLVAALWWCWFNFVNWGDPLEFQRGRYSAQAQQDILDRAGLLPDKQGLHAGGPIDYAECAVPLAISVLSGLAAIKSRLARAGLPPPVFAAAVSGLLLFGMGTFIAWQAGALNAQARIQSEIYDGIERAVETRGGPPAVVIAPRFADVWRANPESLKRGTWVFEWRRARPDLSDDILIVQDVPGAAWIFREKFPDRNLFRMTLAAEPPYWSLEPAKP